MNETMVCVVGNVATQPVYRESLTGPTARFRLAVTARYLDREKNAWTDGHTNFFTVWTRRTLATNVAASVAVGDPLVVQGRLKVRTEQRDGQGWLSADLDAAAIGHDLSRGTSAFRRSARPDVQTGAPPQPEPSWETEPETEAAGRPQEAGQTESAPQPQLEPAGAT
ncbi:single-stranded DNA-binding protein [Streptomyces sp. NPDC057062]|uniref:single-stranded DNA-binding protein n=1 Tax=Streptomyces sp. NPDC057062 TaxID=3346011 RepID=UPI003633D7A0